MKIHPARLRPGSRVALVAPSGPVAPSLLNAGIKHLESWGLRVEIGEHVLDRHPKLPYLAGADADRAADLQAAWCDPDVDAVFCVRGGYGTLRMVDLLDWDAMAAAGPKLFAGSSDITVLHEAFLQHLNVATLFAPMVGTDGFVADAAAREHFRQTLFEPEKVRVLAGPNTATMVHGKATGMVVGGNASLLGSGPPPREAILLLEDVAEDTYRLDRILTALLRSGWFTGVNGIALGSWTNCGAPDVVEAILHDLVGSLGIPTVWELGFGHCAAQLTVPLGVQAELDADNGTLTILRPALSPAGSPG
ncbi:LD-carboxypeptidase [Kibdelosporangium persicum]|uniref:Muramoyltetrapeptide carboxypeptidase n=1 Tax=Kibdelosporangium persicum TaxID=2698649 RepID=A0ABX2F384_9PSEU|nr:LD-carboxypeptidase [Kibdelosporangium persicum]NRN65431.1 Muramoyltetrapeptide carboxypeptidase [Kibdelosporangium persicum]